MIKVAHKQKILKGLKFIEELKSHPKCIPFLQNDQIQRFGCFDFKFINRKFTKLGDIEHDIKESKYHDFEDLVADLKLNFQMVGFYVPLHDPLQNDVKYFLNQIDKWRSQSENVQMIEELQQLRSGQKQRVVEGKQSFNKNIKHYESQRKKKELNYATLEQQQTKLNQMTKAYRLPVRSTLAQKLEMIYFLKAHETNQPFVHMIGDMYGIGKETEDEYVIKLDNSTCCSWLEVLQNNQQME